MPSLSVLLITVYLSFSVLLSKRKIRHLKLPINDRLGDAIIKRLFLIGPKEFVLRSLGRNKVPGENIITTTLYNIIQK